MKLTSTFKKLSLIILLGLGCSPLVANADDGDFRHGHDQQDHGKFHYWAEHRRDHRNYQDNRRHEKRGNYSKHKKLHPAKAKDIYRGHSYNVPSYRIRGHHNIVVVRPYGQRCL